MPRQPPFLVMLLAAMIAGSFAAFVELWPYPLSLRGAVATLSAGAAFGAVLAGSVRFVPTSSRLASFGVCALGGGVGGLAWWLLLRPVSGPLAAILIGGIVALVLVTLVELFGHAAAQQALEAGGAVISLREAECCALARTNYRSTTRRAAGESPAA